jgi:hypothetical protein
MTNDPIKSKGNIQKSLPYEDAAKRFYKLKNEDFYKMIRTWLDNS